MRELVFLRTLDDFRHRGDHFDRIAAGSSFRREHHRIGTVHDGVRDVAHLGTGWCGILDHRLHHLRCRNDDTIAAAALMDDCLLQPRQLGVTHLHAQIATSHHDNIRGVDDARQVCDRLVPLDLRNDTGVTARLTDQAPRLLDVGRITRERHGDVVNYLLRAELDVLAIPVGKGGSRYSATLAVETLAIGELATRTHPGIDSRTADALVVEDDLAVVQQEDIARRHILRQICVGTTDLIDGAPFGVELGIEGEGLALYQHNTAFAKPLDANLRSTEVEEDADAPVRNTRRLAMV